MLYLTLYLDLTFEAPAGAGWYIAVRPSDESIPPIPIDVTMAQRLADTFHVAMVSSEDNPDISIRQIVHEASIKIPDALEQQLEYAEAQAKKVGLLRRKLLNINA